MIRPNCLDPNGCVAKGPGHCRRCAATAQAVINHADPDFRKASRERMKRQNADPKYAALTREGSRLTKDNPDLKSARQQRALALAAAVNGDMDLTARRIAALRASTKSKVKAARRLRIPIQHYAEYRELRCQKFKENEAIGILTRSYPADFKVLRDATIASMRRVTDHRRSVDITATLMGDPARERVPC